MRGLGAGWRLAEVVLLAAGNRGRREKTGSGEETELMWTTVAGCVRKRAGRELRLSRERWPTG